MMFRRLAAMLVALFVIIPSALALAGGDAPSTDPRDLQGKTWRWIDTTKADGRIVAQRPEAYTIRLEDGKLQALFDCNHGGGSYAVGAGTLTFGPMMSTRMACPPGSQDYVFMNDLQQVTGFRVQDGKLLLGLAADGGTMRFELAP